MSEDRHAAGQGFQVPAVVASENRGCLVHDTRKSLAARASVREDSADTPRVDLAGTRHEDQDEHLVRQRQEVRAQEVGRRVAGLHCRTRNPGHASGVGIVRVPIGCQRAKAKAALWLRVSRR